MKASILDLRYKTKEILKALRNRAARMIDQSAARAVSVMTVMELLQGARAEILPAELYGSPRPSS